MPPLTLKPRPMVPASHYKRGVAAARRIGRSLKDLEARARKLAPGQRDDSSSR